MFEISFALSWRDAGGGGGEARSRRSAFARFTRYSASDIAPAIATAVPPSREKIFWTTLDPTKNPFEARLSAARTTPSLLRIPTVVVMSNLESICRWLSMLTRIEDPQSHFTATVTQRCRETVARRQPYFTRLRSERTPTTEFCISSSVSSQPSLPASFTISVSTRGRLDSRRTKRTLVATDSALGVSEFLCSHTSMILSSCFASLWSSSVRSFSSDSSTFLGREY